MANDTFNTYLFKVSGGFDIDARLSPIYDATGQDICGFTLPDGREVNIEICLRTEGNGSEEYFVSEKDMESLGFSCLDYEYADFYEAPSV